MRPNHNGPNNKNPKLYDLTPHPSLRPLTWDIPPGPTSPGNQTQRNWSEPFLDRQVKVTKSRLVSSPRYSNPVRVPPVTPVKPVTKSSPHITFSFPPFKAPLSPSLHLFRLRYRFKSLGFLLRRGMPALIFLFFSWLWWKCPSNVKKTSILLVLRFFVVENLEIENLGLMMLKGRLPFAFLFSEFRTDLSMRRKTCVRCGWLLRKTRKHPLNEFFLNYCLSEATEMLVSWLI